MSRLVAIHILNNRQEFQAAAADAAREAGARLGITVEVQFAASSAITQIQQILSYVRRPAEQRPLAVVVELAGASAAFMATARAALSAGVGWVDISGGTTSVAALRAEFPGRLVMSIATDEEGIGRIHAEQCRALLPAGGSILYIEGPGLQMEVKDRRHGLEGALNGSSITIAKVLAGDWTEESGYRAMSACLDRPSGQKLAPALICSQNDAMALGARRAAARQRPQWDKLPYLGCDALPAGGQRAVAEGILAASVVKPVLTGLAVEHAVRGMDGGPVQDVVILPESFPALEKLRTQPPPGPLGPRR